MIRFGRYQLDPVQGLTIGARPVRLTPRSLAVLYVLAGRDGQVVTKEELFERVWRGTAVSDTALTSCIKELRQALGDDARKPRFIETIHRRGYRFVARTSKPAPGTQTSAVAGAVHKSGSLVGRDPAIGTLLDAFAAASEGARQICFITGEAGVGKTTVLRASIARMAERGGVRVTWGQCIEQYGIGEPYQPLLEALTRLSRGPGGVRVVEVLEHHAPTWLAHLPGVVSPGNLAALQRMAAGTTSGRMVRELANAIEALTAEDALVLCLEDLHWSDASTLDCIATLAARPEPARLLVAATYRPGLPGPEQERPLAALAGGLRAKGLCRDIALTGLDEAAVAEYVVREYPAAPGHDAHLRLLAARVHRHTGGNALFVVTVLKDLAARGLLGREQAGWTLSAVVESLDLGTPDDVRQTIERQIDRLPADERMLLEIASVAGPAFSAAVVAGAAALPAREAESRLASVARHYRFVVEAGVAEWPDGTLATRFEFAHELYRSGLYASLPAGRRVELHRLVATRLESAYGARAPEIAAELAMHFDRGRDAARAIAWLQHAAESARRRSAFNEARLHFERALALLDAGPQGVDRTAEEVKLLIGQGAAIMATRGFGAPEAEAAYSRARTLCREAGETPALFPALWGLWLFYWGRGAVGTASEIAHELQALAAAGDDAGLRLQAHHASWATAFSRGDFEGTRRHAAGGVALYDAGRHAAMGATYGSHDTGVCARMFSARAAVILGQVGEAIRMSDDAIALARALEHRFSIALALTFRAAVDQARRDPASAAVHAGQAMRICREQDFGLMLAWCLAVDGWAEAARGDAGAIARVRAAIDAARAAGSDQFLPHLLATLAEACLMTGRVREGREAIEEGVDAVARSGERFSLSDLHRLRAECLLANGEDVRAAEAAFDEAIEVARDQRARLLVLRAAVGLARLRLREGAADSVRQAMLDARAAIVDGDALPDVIEADALLAAG